MYISVSSASLAFTTHLALTEEELIDLTQIKVPTLIICGSEDPYLNYDLVNHALKDLPKDSALEVIEGGSHVVFVEKPYYHDFQDRLIRYLEN